MRVIVPLSVSLLCACTSHMPAQPITMSTQGSTLVRSAIVVNVRDVTVRGESHSSPDLIPFAGAIDGGTGGQHIEQSGAHRSFTELTVRFDNGDEHTYSVEAGENFQIGDAVKVTTHNAITRITHPESAQP